MADPSSNFFPATAFGVLSAPNPPTNVQAFAGNGKVTVTWVPPLIGQPNSYTVTVGGVSAYTTGTQATVSGLKNGSAVSSSVVATNAAGDSSPAFASLQVTPTASGLSSTQVPVALTGLNSGLLWAWYSASQLVSNPGNGNPLVSGNGGTGIFVNDASGNGRHITVAAAPPTYVTGFRNSTVAFGFDGAAKYLLLPFDTTTWNGPVTLFVVADIQSAATADQHIVANDQYNGTNFVNAPYGFVIDTNGAGAPSIRVSQISNVVNDSTTAITVGNVGTATVFALSETFGAANGGGSQYFSGTKSSGRNNIMSSNTNSMYIGVRGNIANASRFYNGRIAEVIFFAGALSDTDRHTVETYLGTKYNITMASQ